MEENDATPVDIDLAGYISGFTADADYSERFPVEANTQPGGRRAA